ncbi:Six-hairpin glycosidase [Rhizodiscina lignyota]|uniref:Six-hairpin glycosidase n=1 Tax=Rhizodiscina lignyota TaxID=1504668 RepID=A0A9P4M2I3_9PEZI|nr:Six-hairpin glycosidase [Rhizodiscina lignyota]
MQATYWNGSYWPTTIQWIGAVLDTLLAASDRSFTNALIEYNGKVPGAQSSTSQIQSEIQKYFSQVEAYYSNEDTIQIFGAAYDDAQWVVLEWLEALKFINQYDAYSKSSLGQSDIAKFAHRAHIFYNIVQDQFDTSLCGGGLTWNPALATYKNSITNELFVSSSIGMYLYFPGDSNTDPYPNPRYTSVTNNTLPPLLKLAAHDPLLLDNAKKEWTWFKSQPFRNAQGLIIDGFHISDNQTTCDEPNDMIYTYNQGVMLSGLRQLWEATGDTSYLDDAYDQIWSTINATGWFSLRGDDSGAWAGLGRNGIMEDYCDAPANCSQDAQMFKGIFFHHLDAFCEPLPTETPLIPDLTYTAPSSLASSHASKCDSYVPWVEHNAHAALATRNGSNIIGGWWGAAYGHPHPGQDPWNDPGLLNQSPWACRSQHGCKSGGVHGRNPPQVDEGDARNVQTEGSGLGVVKAASDMILKRPPTYPST